MMEDEKFTLGPWKYNEETKTHMSSIESPEGFVCIGMGCMTKKINYADLCLILSSPDMYSALENLFRLCQKQGICFSSTYPQEMKKAATALKKARGEG